MLGSSTKLLLDTTFIYVGQEDTGCRKYQGARHDGGIWRIERATGHARRISKAIEVVDAMLVQGPWLWFFEAFPHCQRSHPRKNEPWWLVRHPRDGGAERRLEFSCDARGCLRPHALRAGNECLYYEQASGDQSVIESLDESSLQRSTLAAGKPFVSVLAGDFFYFLGESYARGVELCRVRRAGGVAERLADDLTDFLYERFLRQGDELILKTMRSGLRVLSTSSDPPVARELVPGAARAWESVEEVTVARGTVVYVFGSERQMEIRAVNLRGGPSWQLAPPYRDPRGLVADDRGVYWINLDEASGRDAVFGCDIAVVTPA